jgi:hypothetical protein
MLKESRSQWSSRKHIKSFACASNIMNRVENVFIFVRTLLPTVKIKIVINLIYNSFNE